MRDNSKIVVSNLRIVNCGPCQVDKLKLVSIIRVISFDIPHRLAALFHAFGKGDNFLFVFPEEDESKRYYQAAGNKAPDAVRVGIDVPIVSCSVDGLGLRQGWFISGLDLRIELAFNLSHQSRFRIDAYCKSRFRE